MCTHNLLPKSYPSSLGELSGCMDGDSCIRVTSQKNQTLGMCSGDRKVGPEIFFESYLLKSTKSDVLQLLVKLDSLPISNHQHCQIKKENPAIEGPPTLYSNVHLKDQATANSANVMRWGQSQDVA